MATDPINGRRQKPGLNGDSATLAVDRAINELKHGRFVAITRDGRALVATALETAGDASIERLRAFAAGAALMLTAERAAALKTGIVGPIGLPLSAFASVEALHDTAGLRGAVDEVDSSVAVGAWRGAQDLLSAGFRLAKVARIVPALIGFESDSSVVDPSIVQVDVDSIDRVASLPGLALQPVSNCRVPLVDAEASVVTLFRDPFGGAEHVAVTIGEPDFAASVPVRLHSACLTGDVLGSLRCDCGEQLRTAVRRIAELGGGVLLYLDQEGRGIGLANKLRAYRIQDAGLDTLDADRHLGFRADERNYGVAAAMLASLGIERVQLLTNNPQKIAALRELGIDVIGRLPLVTSTNVHNERYLKAKRERAGHLSEDTGS